LIIHDVISIMLPLCDLLSIWTTVQYLATRKSSDSGLTF